MRRVKKILKWTLIILIIGIGSLAVFVKVFLPNVGDAPDMKVSMDADKIARGEYLANHVCVCMDCHGTRDWTRFSGPPTDGAMGKGGELFDQKFGFPGKFTSKNITPFALKNWTDGEIFRAITCGVNKSGKALFPVMPYTYYGKMDPEDIKCIIAYLRSLPEINYTPEASVSDFPMNFIINTIPAKQTPGKLPSTSDVLAYGKYLVNAAGCVECHTPAEKGQIIAGKEFSGGRDFQFPDGSIIRSANITPDQETGIGAKSSKDFIDLFHARSDSAALAYKLKPGEMQTVMPWTMYGRMKDEDLNAIYSYLHSLTAIKNPVEKFTPAK
jgi:mono/diheme cytochrome c family protein